MTETTIHLPVYNRLIDLRARPDFTAAQTVGLCERPQPDIRTSVIPTSILVPRPQLVENATVRMQPKNNLLVMRREVVPMNRGVAFVSASGRAARPVAKSLRLSHTRQPQQN